MEQCGGGVWWIWQEEAVGSGGNGNGAAVHRLGFGALLKGECRERLSGGICTKVDLVSM